MRPYLAALARGPRGRRGGMTPEDPDTIMLGNAYSRPVHRALADLSGRKRARFALSTYAELLCFIAPDTGEITTPLEALVAHAGVPRTQRESIVDALARLRIVVRDPRSDRDAWCINPHLAWCGSLEARARFAAVVQPPAVEPRADA